MLTCQERIVSEFIVFTENEGEKGRSYELLVKIYYENMIKESLFGTHNICSNSIMTTDYFFRSKLMGDYTRQIFLCALLIERGFESLTSKVCTNIYLMKQ